MKNLLNEAIQKINNLPEEDKVRIHKKLYSQVATRLEIFRDVFGTDARIDTNIVSADLKMVCMRAEISIYQNGRWEKVADGHAEEFRGEGMINKTSALENCETSAIGRALANLGLHGGEYASSFEVENATKNKAKAPKIEDNHYSYKNLQGSTVDTADTPVAYLELLRGKINKPDDVSHQALYKVNVDDIKRALTDSDDETKESFTKLVDAYESF